MDEGTVDEGLVLMSLSLVLIGMVKAHLHIVVERGRPIGKHPDADSLVVIGLYVV